MRSLVACAIALPIVAVFAMASPAHAAKGDAAKGKAIYEKSCAMCHGSLAAKKPTLPNAADFFKGSFPRTKGNDKELDKMIKLGGAGYGKGASPQMPPQAISEKERTDVIAFIKSLKKKK